MKKMMYCVFVVIVVALFIPKSLYADVKDSQDFPLKYEGDALPTQVAAMPWDLAQTDTSVEALRCSSVGGILKMAVPASKEVGWFLPGETGDNKAPSANRHYPLAPDYNSALNPWDPDCYVGYTVEVRLQVLNSDTARGFCLYSAEGPSPQSNSYGSLSSVGTIWNVCFFKDKIMQGYDNHDFPGEAVDTLLYTGNLSDTMHTIRFVRYWGAVSFAHSIYMEIFVDGNLVSTTGSAYCGGIMHYAYLYEDWLFMGSKSTYGSGGYNVDIDYVRADFTGAYRPVPAGAPACGEYRYLDSDINNDCTVNIKDFAIISGNWMYSTEPGDPLEIDCTNPINSDICE